MHKMLLDIHTQMQTDRLLLRCYEPGDGQWYYRVGQKNQAHLQQYESDNVILSARSPEGAEISIREMIAGWVARNCFFLGAFEKTSAAFVAQVYVRPVDWKLLEFEIGYFVDVDQQGKGYMTEAVNATLGWLFDHLEAHRVRLRCDDTNVRSARVAERCGFTREVHLRENKLNPDGTFSGTLYYGILKSDYQAQRNASQLNQGD